MSVGPGSPADVIFVLFLSLEAFVSVFTNIFITSVILHDYHVKKNLTSVQKIQAALSMSSTFFIAVSSFDVFSHLILPESSKTLDYNIAFVFLFVYCICSSSWLTAVLCFYYFIKVVDVQRGFFGWMKEKITSIVHWLIVLETLCSLVNSLFSLRLFAPNQSTPTNGSSILTTSLTLEQTSLNYQMTKVVSIMIFLPLLFTVITTILTVGFLKLHRHKMKNSRTSGEASQTLYKQVICKMMRFLLLYSAFYLVIFLYYFSVFAQGSSGYYINLMLMFLFPPIQSALHILDNQHLRSTWKEMVRCIMRSPHRNA